MMAFRGPGAALAALLVGLLAPAVRAQGETIVVTAAPDVSDFAFPRRVAQLPGPDGVVTFREAVAAANNTPGPQTIAFQIPPSEWASWFPYGAMVFSNVDSFIFTDDSTTVDGRTQTAFTGDTNPSGNEVAFWGEHPNSAGSPMMLVRSSGNLFVGLDAMHQRGSGIAFAAGAEGNRVVGCTIDGPLHAAVLVEGSRNTIGGTAPGEGNRLASGDTGVRVQSAWGESPPEGNRIVGNHISGTAVGVQVRGGAVGTVVGGPTPAERNVIAGVGHFGEEGFPTGTMVSIGEATDTVVEGNLIGTTPDGLAAAPGQKGTRGVVVQSAPGTTVRGNVVSGILIEGVDHALGQFFGVGVEIGPGAPGTVVERNLVGVGADGVTPVPNLVGMEVTGGSDAPVTVGGVAPGAGNTVAHNVRTGIALWAFVRRAAVLGNDVFENGLLGIDLEDFSGRGATPNDPGDPDDEGANRLQNTPGVASASREGGTLTVTYAVDTAPANATYPLRVEFFAADSDGTEGRLFLGADTYTEADYAAGAPGTRTATLDVGGADLPEGSRVLATATDAAGNTSEFSAGEPVTFGTAADGAPQGDGLRFSAPSPNPARGRADLTLTLGAAQAVRVEAFDALGRRVAVLHDSPLAAGAHALSLDTAPLSPGVYVVRATAAGGARTTRRLLVTR